MNEEKMLKELREINLLKEENTEKKIIIQKHSRCCEIEYLNNNYYLINK